MKRLVHPQAAELMTMPHDQDHGRLIEWVEQVAMFCADEYGVPPIAGRILGWLMICDPPEQSASEIADAIGASRASLTTNMRVLTDAKFVSRRTHPGGRTNYYRVDDNAWEAVVRRRVASLTAFRDIAAEGMKLAGLGTVRAERIHAAHDIYEWMANAFAQSAPPTPENETHK